jgi:anti-sigma regulatory factor (Ser/Thr protein kinase)
MPRIAFRPRSASTSGPARDRPGPGAGPLPTRVSPVDNGVTLRIGGGPDAAAHARRALATLRTDLDPPLEETLRLLVTELVANSVRHAKADAVTLRVVVGPSAVRTEVTDSGPGFDPSRTGSPRDDHTGWGLFLVERLADRWGVAKAGEATRVWFELARA